MKIYKPYNKMKHPKNYWKCKNNVLAESRKYSCRTDFKKGSYGAYKNAINNGWINEMVWLDLKSKHPKGYWKNKKNIFLEAKKYNNKEEFQRENPSAFLAAYKYAYIDDMKWLVRQEQHKKGYWDYDAIESEAVKYKTKTAFFRGCQTAYRKALEMGIIDDFFTSDYIDYDKD